MHQAVFSGVVLSFACLRRSCLRCGLLTQRNKSVILLRDLFFPELSLGYRICHFFRCRSLFGGYRYRLCQPELNLICELPEFPVGNIHLMLPKCISVLRNCFLSDGISGIEPILLHFGSCSKIIDQRKIRFRHSLRRSIFCRYGCIRGNVLYCVLRRRFFWCGILDYFFRKRFLRYAFYRSFCVCRRICILCIGNRQLLGCFFCLRLSVFLFRIN